jgi:hypothetical protein
MLDTLARREFMPLPVEIGQIDAAWLTAALRTRTPGVTVRAMEVADVRHGTCTKIRLRLDLDDAAERAGIPRSVILKGGFEQHSRDMAYMHETEVRGYQEVLGSLGLPSPACYFAAYDAERGQGVIVMEDLVARGVRFCDPLKPQGFDEVARRLTELARFHAKSWGSPEFRPGGRWEWQQDVMPDVRSYAQPFLKPEVWDRFVGSPRGAAVSVRFHSAEWMADAFDRMVLLSATEPHCVLHGDTHLGNLYVDPDGTPGFFDSLPAHGPAMSEVAYHMACALDTADRRRWEGALVGHYLGQLRANGVAAPDFDDAMHQYAVYLARAYFIFIINDADFQSEAVNTAYTARISAAMIDHDTIGRLAAIG